MSWQVLEGDCLALLGGMEEASVDAVVCDPPYGLEFMGKEWDSLAGDWRTDEGRGEHAAASGRPSGKRGFDGHPPTPRFHAGPRAQEWHHTWALEALRILKPGGHLLAFGGTRTYHRLACAVEDAGFEIRDSLIWLYGSGFPKSLDVSKAIDKAAGKEGGYGAPKSEAHAGWIERGAMRGEEGHEGYQRPWMQDGEAVDRNARQYEPATEDAQRWQGWGTALKPGHELIVVARKPLSGTVAANVLEYGTGALNVDGCRIEGDSGDGHWTHKREIGDGNIYGGGGRTDEDFGSENPAAGRWPANVVLDEQAAEELDAQSGERRSPASYTRGEGDERTEGRTYGDGRGFPRLDEVPSYGDSGGASRFYYTAKASRAERNAGLEDFEALERVNGNKWTDRDYRVERGERTEGRESGPRRNVHPTVKPISLMRWLCRLVTPPGGKICDPFVGSGTTGIAAILEGFDFIGIEREAEYVEIAKARIAWWEQHRGREADEVLAASSASERERREHEAAGQAGLFDEIEAA